MLGELVVAVDDLLAPKHCTAKTLERLFAEVFFWEYKTVLVGGAEEPLYQPAGIPSESAVNIHQLFYREDFASSALHEISHWCLAGEKRRQQVDFGYWYIPDGRDQEQQRLFEKMEVKPQALEWMFSIAAGLSFTISVDNLSGEEGASREFLEAVSHQARQWCGGGLPERATRFIKALSEYQGSAGVFDVSNYST